MIAGSDPMKRKTGQDMGGKYHADDITLVRQQV